MFVHVLYKSGGGRVGSDTQGVYGCMISRACEWGPLTYSVPRGRDATTTTAIDIELSGGVWSEMRCGGISEGDGEGKGGMEIGGGGWEERVREIRCTKEEMDNSGRDECDESREGDRRGIS